MAVDELSRRDLNDTKMNTMIVDYPVKPPGMEMPLFAQEVFLYVSVVASLALAVFAIWQSRRYRSAMPILYFLAGLFSILLEPLANNLGQIFHPEIGQIAAFKTMDRLIPWHIVLVYPLYFSLPIIYFSRFVERSLGRRDIWKLFVTFLISNYLFEMIAVQTGLWIYYGNQALWFWKGGIPLYVAFANPVMCLIPFVVQYAAMPYLTGWRRILVIPVNISVSCGALVANGALWMEAAHSSWGQAVVQAAGIGSILMGLTLLWLCTSIFLDTHKAPAKPAFAPQAG